MIDDANREHSPAPEVGGERDSRTSRRGFLSGSAKVLGSSALVLALGGGTALAQERTDGGVGTQAEGASIIEILNYALILERLEAEFYRRILQRFSESQFENSNYFNGLGPYVTNNIHENLVRIRNHEQTHVETLVALIRQRGGDPLPDSEYNFGVSTVADAVRTAQLLENTGVSAYTGAIAYIGSPGVATASATVATVEARHAAYLNLINRDVPFPAAFDTPKSPRDICRTVDEAFITSSPYNLSLFCSRLPDRVITP